MKLEKTSVKQPIKIYLEVKEGKLYIMATAEVENLYLQGSKIVEIANLKEAKHASKIRSRE